MDPRLLRYYEKELQFIREMGSEFSRQYPKIASRLNMDGLECADPYVERLLEGFAFLTARVQLKMDAEYPQFTENLLDIIYPQYLSPTPSMAIVQFKPSLTEGALTEGFRIERGTVLRTAVGGSIQTSCSFLTAHNVDLWPIKIEDAVYIGHPGALSTLEIPESRRAKAALKIVFKTVENAPFSGLSINNISMFLNGKDSVPANLYEQFFAAAYEVIVRPAKKPVTWQVRLPSSLIKSVGFSSDEALLPRNEQSFEGYRLIHEYFSFPQRFLSVELTGLSEPVGKCDSDELEVVVLFDRANQALENAVTEDSFSLFTTPVINLFPKRADRIQLSNTDTEFAVIPDRTKPLDYEVYSVEKVTGFSDSGNATQSFRPFYGVNDTSTERSEASFFTVHRRPRVSSSSGRRSSYAGNDVFISLVDANEAPISGEIRQVGVETLCTNRDLPLFLGVGSSDLEFSMDISAPVEGITCIAGPTRPRAGISGSKISWHAISHLSLNYLSITDNDNNEGAAAIREMLRLYLDPTDVTQQRKIDGISSIEANQVVRRIESGKMLAFGPGLEITLTCDEESYTETGLVLFGAVMEEFFSRYVSINSFTETVIKSIDRGEIKRWPSRTGRTATI